MAISLNFYERTVTFSKPYFLTNNKEKDFKILRNYFKGSVGKIKELS